MKNFIVIAILALTTLLLADFPGFNFYSAWQKPVPEGELNGSSIGRGMAIIKDINHDGYDELAVAAELACDTATAEIRGKVYIYMGGQGAPLTLPEQPTVVLRGEKHRDWYGFDISSGDFNGDGNTDVAILAQGNNDNSHIYNYGRAYLYLGTDPPSLAPGEFMDTVPDLIYTPPNATGFLYQLPFVGDINDDGYDDIAIPLRCFSLGIKKTLLFYGDSLPDLIADDSIIVDDTPFYDIAVGCGGDINGDGIADLMIGSRCAGNDTGKVFIFPGGNPFVTEPSKTAVFMNSPD